MRSAPRQLEYADRVIILLAVKFGCSVSAETERRIRADERIQVADQLQALGILAISRHPSHRRIAARRYLRAFDLVADVRRDERLLMVRELRREAKIAFAAGINAADLELAATQLDKGTPKAIR
jgi:hypothetical protein